MGDAGAVGVLGDGAAQGAAAGEDRLTGSPTMAAPSELMAPTWISGAITAPANCSEGCCKKVNEASGGMTVTTLVWEKAVAPVLLVMTA